MTFHSNLENTQPQKTFSRGEIIKLVIVGLGFILGSVLILEFQFTSGEIAQLSVGDIASQDIIATQYTSYESPIATEQEKNRAESQVELIYSRPNAQVARTQRATADSVLNLIDAIRTDPDPYLTAEKKLAWLQDIEPISLNPEEAAAILNLSDQLWLDAKKEVRSVLDEAMRNEIRESQLFSVRRRLDLFISPDVPDTEAKVVIAIVEDLVQPNTFVDEERTNEARQRATDSVNPVIKTLEENEIIVRAGERVTAENIEALRALGLQEPETRLRDIVSTIIWMTLLTALFGYYLFKYQIVILKNNQKLLWLSGLMLVFITALRVLGSQGDTLFYALPMAALAIIVAVLLDPQLAIIVSLIMGLVAAYIGNLSMEMFVYILVSGFVVALTVGPMAQLNSLLWAGVYTVFCNILVILIFYFFEGDIIWVDFARQMGAASLNGVLSAGIALIAFFIIGNVTDMITYIQLLDLSRPTHPLLMDLLRRAPGTYHHSLLVSNLAEQAAERIGANAFLCRIGAYYHDVGKMERPYFFTENMSADGINPHNNLDPETSAQIIISHVTDGLKMAKKHRLPSALLDFIAEHHGTETAGYFLHQAIQNAGGDESLVDKTLFTYPGPAPRSRETGILMLADATEATVRSVKPQTPEEIDQIVRRTISRRIQSGQFNNCDLSMRDMEQIRLAFNDVLRGVSHPRVKYPDQIKEEKIPDTGPLPPLPLAVQSASLGSNVEPSGSVKSKFPIQRD